MKTEDRQDAAADRPTQAEAESAVRTLIRWAGDRPEREGLQDTPARVARSFAEFFAGYELDPVEPIGRHSRAKRYGASKDKTICPGEYGERWLDGWLAGRS